MIYVVYSWKFVLFDSLHPFCPVLPPASDSHQSLLSFYELSFLFCSLCFRFHIISHSLWLHELQYARLPCPSPTPGVYPNSCPLSRWCHLSNSSSVIPFSSYLESFLTSGSFQMRQLFATGSQNIGVSASTLVLPVHIQGWFPLWWTGWLHAVQANLKSLLQHHSSKASVLWHSAFFIVQLSHPYMTTGKIMILTRWTFVGKVMPLLFNMLSSLVIAFLPRSKCLLISWLQSPSAVILEPKKIKSITAHLFAMKW